MQIRNPQTIKRDRWPELLETAAVIGECPIYVDDRGSLKIQELLASARLYIRRHGVKLVVVDYLRLVDAPSACMIGWVMLPMRCGSWQRASVSAWCCCPNYEDQRAGLTLGQRCWT